MNPEIISSSASNFMSSVTVSRPALSWCSKCGQSMEISSESNLFKSKTNFKFRKIFDLDNSEVLIKTFSCALVDDILFQGTLYTSQNHFCFFSRIANKHKKIIISISQIIEITKEKTAGIFPNAIAIKTQHNRHLFASFVYREVAFRCLNEVWSAHHAERFTANWTIAFSDDACIKESPLLDIEFEADPLINPMILNGSGLMTKDLLHGIQDYSLEIEESPDLDLSDSKLLSRTMYHPLGSVRRLSNESTSTHVIPDYKNQYKGPFSRQFLNNTLDLISKEHLQLFLAALIIIFLILYIIILAWKIHNLQIILLEQFLSPKVNSDSDKVHNMEFVCPSTDGSCTKYKDSVSGHQSRISKVQSDLKETLNLLQSVVEVSGKIFGRLKSTPLTSIITPHQNSDET